MWVSFLSYPGFLEDRKRGLLGCIHSGLSIMAESPLAWDEDGDEAGKEAAKHPVKAHVPSRPWLSAGPQTAAHLAPLSVGFSRQECLEWASTSSSRGSSQPRDRTHIPCVSCIGKWIILPLCHLGNPTRRIGAKNSDGLQRLRLRQMMNHSRKPSRT